MKLVVCLEADHRNDHCCAHLGLITAVSRMGRVLTTVEEVAARPERGIDRLRNGLIALKRPVILIPILELHLGRLASEEVLCH